MSVPFGFPVAQGIGGNAGLRESPRLFAWLAAAFLAFTPAAASAARHRWHHPTPPPIHREAPLPDKVIAPDGFLLPPDPNREWHT